MLTVYIFYYISWALMMRSNLLNIVSIHFDLLLYTMTQKMHDSNLFKELINMQHKIYNKSMSHVITYS